MSLRTDAIAAGCDVELVRTSVRVAIAKRFPGCDAELLRCSPARALADELAKAAVPVAKPRAKKASGR